jgi:replicative DNA helicase
MGQARSSRLGSRDQSLEQALPNSAEAERAMLGGVLLNNDLMPQMIEEVPPDALYVPSHRKIYSAMIRLFERGAEINPILIREELKKSGEIESVGGVSFISNLTYGLPHSSTIKHYAKVVNGLALARNLFKTTAKVQAEILAGEDDPEEIYERAEAAIFQLGQRKIRSTFTHVVPVAERLLDKIQAMEGRADMVTGLPTGFKDLDRMTTGLQKADLNLVAGRPSMGKTSFAIMLAENAARLVPGAVIGIFSLEMSKEALAMRLICGSGNLDAQRFRQGFLSRLEWAQVSRTLSGLQNARIFLDDTAGITPLELRAKGRRLATEQKRLDLIIIDYLQLMSGSGRRFESRQQEVSQISRELKGIAKELDVPLVALSQLSRAPEGRSDPRPKLSDLRESGALEQDADLVAFIFNAEMLLSPEQRDALPLEERNIAEIIVAKQRNGPTGTVELRWTPSSMRFDNLYKEN